MRHFRRHHPQMNFQLAQWLPVLNWARNYNKADFRQDLMAGTIVLFITIPQVIAYAFLAGLPAEAGLYAAVVALLAYALLGTSKVLAVGPTAIVAMMTLEAASDFAVPGSASYLATVIQLTWLTGLILIVLRLVNFGSVISFLSHAVITGFISAAALVIIFNQVPTLLGLNTSLDSSPVGVLNHLIDQVGSANTVVIGISAVTLLLLVFCRFWLGPLLRGIGYGHTISEALVKSAPMYAVLLGILIVQFVVSAPDVTVPVVGSIPNELPRVVGVSLDFSMVEALLPSAILIAMVIFMESTSIGTAMASKSRDKIHPNQELVGLGVANVGSSLVGGLPVAGSFARTAVNFASGAISPVASLVTGFLVIVTLLLFANVFHDLPKGVLAAIIVVAAIQLIDLQVIRKIFAFNATDAVTFSFTFLAVLVFGVESGVLIGVAISFVLLIRSSSRPHIVVVGRIGSSEQFRNVERYDAATSPRVIAVRVDESLYFVNTRYIENYILTQIAASEEVEHLLLICHATNFIDTSGLDMLEELSENLGEVGITLHLAEVKGPVMDKLKETSFYNNMKGQVFFTTSDAMKELAGV